MNNREERFAVRLSTDLNVDIVEMNLDQPLLDFCYNAISCNYIEIVMARYLAEPYTLIIDEEGRLRDDPKINFIASYLYGTHEHHEPIVGNALIMKTCMTEDGPDILPLNYEEANMLSKEIEINKTELVVPVTSLKIMISLEESHE